LAQHLAVSLWLTVRRPFIYQAAMPLIIQRGEAPKYETLCTGEPEAHRHVLRQRRILSLPVTQGTIKDTVRASIARDLHGRDARATLMLRR
jgi:hypothetical protein